MPKLKVVKDRDAITFPKTAVADIQLWCDKKCNSSMIGPEDADKLGLLAATRSMSEQYLGYEFSDGLVIPYLHPFTGKPLPASQSRLDAKNTDDGYVRMRNMHYDPSSKDWPHSNRYVGPSGVGCGAYYPFTTNWQMVKDDKDIPIYICEGELKAACMSVFYKEAAIGLGGVTSWSGSTYMDDAAPNLVMFKDIFANREVVVVFDDDIDTNEMVAKALNNLLNFLKTTGAKASYIPLPHSGVMVHSGKHEDNGKPIMVEEKNAIDDMAYRDPLKAPEVFKLLTRYEHNAVVAIDEINKGYAVINEGPMSGSIIKLPTPGDQQTRYVSQENFNRTFNKKIPMFAHEWDPKKNKYSPKLQVKESAAQLWLESPLRREVAEPEFRPGEEPFFYKEGSTLVTPNIWIDDRVKPVKGPRGCLNPWFVMLRQIMGTSPTWESEVDWLMKWLAHTVRFPGVKMATGVVAIGEQGTGKSELGQAIANLHGSYARRVSQSALEGKFNGFMGGATFIYGDEVNSRHKRDQADVLKNLIDQQTVFIEHKGFEGKNTEVFGQIYLTTNHRTGLVLEGTDRRFFMPYSESMLDSEGNIDAGKEHKLRDIWCDKETYNKFVDLFVKTKEGSAWLMYHLMHEVDLTGFNSKTRPPMTEAKADMVSSSDDTHTTWLREFMIDPCKVNPMYAMRVKIIKNGFAKPPLVDFNELYDDFIEVIKPSYKPSKAQFKHAAQALGWVLISQVKVTFKGKKVAAPTLLCFDIDENSRSFWRRANAKEVMQELLRIKHHKFV